MRISMVQSGMATETKDVDVHALLTAIRNGKWRKPIEQIRAAFHLNNGDRKAIDESKKKLPGVTPAGTFSRRASDALTKHSGLICADLDKLGEKLSAVRGDLRLSPHLFALFMSPSGDGLKAFFRVPADPARHGDSFRAVAQHAFNLTPASGSMPLGKTLCGCVS